ncbi:MAG: geranylgeranylglyceryl/heptaprenylglyceryl phosphate synthase [Burkholderiales bacterium]|nr:geranylgeranylglyceryl/heptaprenylglyceryl phosphate synthase [Flavobacterium sp.]
MSLLYSQMLLAKAENQKLLAILLDPDKIDFENIAELALKINHSPATHILVGGSLVLTDKIDVLILALKQNCSLPIILFPGNPSQISPHADGILFLSLISGRNPDYLIEHHVNAVPIIKKSNLEVIPTGYLLIESGHRTAVSTVSNTAPLLAENVDYIVHTAQAGEMLGKKLIYLEAGSGAKIPVSQAIIRQVSAQIEIPLIVGGGIRNQEGIALAYASGADMVVIGTAFENDHNFFNS